MKLHLFRYSENDESTLGLLYINGKFACYTLEDQFNQVKKWGETRIPVGNYKITLRTVGGFHERYKVKFKDIHKGTLWIRDIPNFEYVLIHCGNTDKDTAGCILVGDSSLQNVSNRGYIGDSVKAYRRIYPAIAQALTQGEHVTIEISDLFL